MHYERPKAVKHFFDVGANIGQTFKDYLNPSTEFDGWDVWCFEPSPRHLPELMAECKRQSAHGRYKIHVCPFGLAFDSASSVFYQKDDPRGDSFAIDLESDHKPLNEDHGYSLHCATLSVAEFILQNTMPEDKILLKVDAEGSEYALLTDLLSSPISCSRISEILVEWHRCTLHPGDWSTEQITAVCAEAGIKIRKWQF